MICKRLKCIHMYKCWYIVLLHYTVITKKKMLEALVYYRSEQNTYVFKLYNSL